LSHPVDWSWLTNHAKATGKTTALVAATKAINGTLVCHDQRRADEIKREQGIRTMSMHAEARGRREPFLFEPEVVGLICTQYERRVRSLVQQQAALEQINAEMDSALCKSEDRFDCRGGPGTTNPACGGCITCLHRHIAAQERAIEIARKQGPCDPFCRMPPRAIMNLSADEQLAWRKARREQHPDGVPCDCWKSNMNAALKGT
jgi:hypothetical protein